MFVVTRAACAAAFPFGWEVRSVHVEGLHSGFLRFSGSIRSVAVRNPLLEDDQFSHTISLVGGVHMPQSFYTCLVSMRCSEVGWLSGKAPSRLPF